jgi:ribose transport system permease protein
MTPSPSTSRFKLSNVIPPTAARLLGIVAIVLILYAAVLSAHPRAGSLENHQIMAKRIGFYGVITLAAGLLIIAGGIDLSIGSVVGLSQVCLALLLEKRVDPLLAMALVLAGSSLIGLFHGLLVTKGGLQPFIVTLCGLFIYRGLAQWATLASPWAPLQRLLTFVTFGLYASEEGLQAGSSRNVGISGRADLEGLRSTLATGTLSDVFPSLQDTIPGHLPTIFLLLLGLAAVATVFLHYSVYGRYFFAIGYNEQAARYAGIATDRYKILAYVLCSTLAGLGGVLEMLRLQNASPSTAGSWYELYAITGAVLGGCSLRGGQGTILGILLGTTVLPLLRNLCNFAGVPDDLEPTVIGVALLVGTIADEVLKRRTGKKT